MSIRVAEFEMPGATGDDSVADVLPAVSGVQLPIVAVAAVPVIVGDKAVVVVLIAEVEGPIIMVDDCVALVGVPVAMLDIPIVVKVVLAAVVAEGEVLAHVVDFAV